MITTLLLWPRSIESLCYLFWVIVFVHFPIVVLSLTNLVTNNYNLHRSFPCALVWCGMETGMKSRCSLPRSFFVPLGNQMGRWSNWDIYASRRLWFSGKIWVAVILILTRFSNPLPWRLKKGGKDSFRFSFRSLDWACNVVLSSRCIVYIKCHSEIFIVWSMLLVRLNGFKHPVFCFSSVMNPFHSELGFIVLWNPYLLAQSSYQDYFSNFTSWFYGLISLDL